MTFVSVWGKCNCVKQKLEQQVWKKKNTYHTVEDEARQLIYLCMALSKATTQSVQLPDLRCQYVAMAIGTACSGLPHGEESAS